MSPPGAELILAQLNGQLAVLEGARAELEVMEIDTERVPLQGETPAFRSLVTDLKRRYPPQVELKLDAGPR